MPFVQVEAQSVCQALPDVNNKIFTFENAECLEKVSSFTTYMFHSEILASLNFNKNQDIFSWIGEQWCIELVFRQFFNIFIYIMSVAKLPTKHFSVSLFSDVDADVDNILIL